ncbi:MAG: heavy-metal-associated domain-containing protein [Prolixibacteraceae bacterium]
MNTLKFKTNVNCGGCIATITPFLNKATQVAKWEVDTTNPNKIMTIETAEMTATDVIELMKTAGYKAELLTE